MKTLKKVLYASGSGCLALAMLTCSANADVITLYEDASDFAGISEVESDGTTFVVENITNSAIGDGDALRIFDGSDTRKPQAYWDLDDTINDAFRLDFSAAIANADSMNQNDILLRFGNNNTDRPDSSSRTFGTFSFEQDGSLKSDGSTRGDFLAGPLDISIVGNINSTPLTYTLFGVDRTLDPLSTDLYVDGVLVEASEALNIGSNIVVADGINEFGFLGQSDATVGGDFSFDNVILFTGSDISTSVVPEPSSAALLMGGLFSLGLVRRRK